MNLRIRGKYDAKICLGNSFTHLHDEQDRCKTLAQFYAALRHNGILILDQRNYDESSPRRASYRAMQSGKYPYRMYCFAKD